jgi:hypothetical protein
MRITDTHLNNAKDLINKLTNSPLKYFSDDEDRKINIGHYHIYQSLGYYSLVKTVNDGGGVSTILAGESKRELYNLMHAFIKGYETK